MLALTVFSLLGLSLLVPRERVEATHGKKLDHFKCYRTEPVLGVVGEIDVDDQFLSAPARVTASDAFVLCNPVEKRHRGKTEIENPNAHLVFYFLNPPLFEAPSTVEVRNQFGRQQLELLPVPLLAVPSWKDPATPPTADTPPGLDHFLCRPAFGPPLNVTVSLRDQFGSERKVKVQGPELFCNPASKVHADLLPPRSFGIEHPEEHLTCYHIEEHPVSRTVTIVNQFHSSSLTVTTAFDLCVPSRKLSESP